LRTGWSHQLAMPHAARFRTVVKSRPRSNHARGETTPVFKTRPWSKHARGPIAGDPWIGARCRTLCTSSAIANRCGNPLCDRQSLRFAFGFKKFVPGVIPQPLVRVLITV
jgi:hypothetical protein